MALGRYTRVDNKQPSSSYCSTVTVAVFVALCLVGVWMMTSLSVVPVQNVDLPQEKKHEVKEHTPEISEGNGKAATDDATIQAKDNKEIGNTVQFEDSPGDLPEDATKGNANDSSSQENQEQKQDVNSELKTDQKEGLEEETKSGDEGKKIEDGESNEKMEEMKNEVGQDHSAGQGESGERSEEKKSDSDEAEKKTNLEDETNKTKEQNESKIEERVDQSDNNESSVDSNEKKDEIPSEDQNQTEVSTSLTQSEKSNSDDNEKSDLEDIENTEQNESKIDERVDQSDSNEASGDSSDKKDQIPLKDQNQTEVLFSVAQSELLNETTTQNGAFSTQAAESKNEVSQASLTQETGFRWKLCNVTAGPDYIPCLDNWQAIRNLPSTKHYEHRERHCPENQPICLVPQPEGYRRPIQWPKSREKIWYSNVPHTKLAEVKGHQNWVKVTGEYLTFPGGGTQFKHGALHYIDFIQESVPGIAWGKHTRVILDVGCGVASFGGFLFDRGALTMSFAPKDEHEAQVQFALERGIPAISAVMGTTRLPFPGRVFDVVHCARCRVPWHIEGGKLLLELNRVLRPGGFFVWSATPVYRKDTENKQIWKAMSQLTKAMCWELVSINKDVVNEVSIATYRKPITNECYEKRTQADPPLCADSDDANAAWNVPLQACMHKVPTESEVRGSHWPEQWPTRLNKPPYWLLSTQVGVYGKPAPEDFTIDYEHWKRVVSKSYLIGFGIDWSTVRNVMDMRSVYGGFAAALKNLSIWVMNVVSIDAPDTLPIIYERGLFGIYHDWCESFSTYPRSYDLLHADHLFSKIKNRCKLEGVAAEADRMLRPEGKLIVRDDAETIGQLENIFRSMQWSVRMTYSKGNESLLCIQKSPWRPTEWETLTYAIA
ncbi:hypothetical protein SAY86_020317 [Trapa natans]|uniref:Uncharacterized protein n=1 Tax=Trapa natans TaxID=22666 RepID=A0AAN7LIU4_TRANT|nr:hypothetical protein SAY86_020317 [Trapa natans]